MNIRLINKTALLEIQKLAFPVSCTVIKQAIETFFLIKVKHQLNYGFFIYSENTIYQANERQLIQEIIQRIEGV